MWAVFVIWDDMYPWSVRPWLAPNDDMATIFTITPAYSYLYRLLERLPVIIEDYTDWQRDFWDLQTQKAQFGKQYPSEMGFKYDDEKPLTMEEILEQSPIPLAPRRCEFVRTYL